MYMEPFTPLTAVSIGMPIVSATTRALAPGNRVDTYIVGGTIWGY